MTEFKPPRKKACRICRQKFQPTRAIQPTCGEFNCLVAYAEKIAAKSAERRKAAERIATKARRERLKSRADYMREAQQAVNEYVRYRDRDLPCVSCGRHHQGQYHAGHYRSVGAAPELRFNLDNIHKQCAPCNNHKSGNIIEYRIRLVKKIGLARVGWLEGRHEPLKLTIEEIKALRDDYRLQLRELKALERKAA